MVRLDGGHKSKSEIHTSFPALSHHINGGKRYLLLLLFVALAQNLWQKPHLLISRYIYIFFFSEEIPL